MNKRRRVTIYTQMRQPLSRPWHAALTPVRRILNCKRCREDHTHNESMSDAATASLRLRNTGRPKCGVHPRLRTCTTTSETSLSGAFNSVRPSHHTAAFQSATLFLCIVEQRSVRNEARNSPRPLETALITPAAESASQSAALYLALCRHYRVTDEIGTGLILRRPTVVGGSERRIHDLAFGSSESLQCATTGRMLN